MASEIPTDPQAREAWLSDLIDPAPNGMTRLTTGVVMHALVAEVRRLDAVIADSDAQLRAVREVLEGERANVARERRSTEVSAIDAASIDRARDDWHVVSEALRARLAALPPAPAQPSEETKP